MRQRVRCVSGLIGTHFTCFTSTKVQIRTPEELRERLLFLCTLPSRVFSHDALEPQVLAAPLLLALLLTLLLTLLLPHASGMTARTEGRSGRRC
jgi:hypothetical protein